jgi:hypothetical protein
LRFSEETAIAIDDFTKRIKSIRTLIIDGFLGETHLIEILPKNNLV